VTTRIGIDIGGTFTDLVICDDAGQIIEIVKVLTTPAQPADAVIAGLRQALQRVGREAGQLDGIVHATTLVPNALIERKGATVGLVTTAGFADSLEIGREDRYDMYDLFLQRAEPLVPRHRRAEVRERVLSDGTIAEPLEEADARRSIEKLLAGGATSIAVSLLNAHVDDRHEQRISAIVRDLDPDMAVTLAAEVTPQIREFERASTAAANAFVKPVVATYVDDLERRLAALGYGKAVYFMLSSTGLATADTTKRFPIRLVESGPAAGVLAAAHLAKQHGEDAVLSFDMGGTTAKTCIIERGEPVFAREFEVARVDRFKRGSGLPLLVPSVELVEIGAGGGSIARVDKMGLLKVGPESASSVPGPACYGRGGRHPTVTDADLVLGYLDPRFFLGGAMTLDPEAARAAIDRHVASKLGVTVAEAAWGIHRIVNENMAAAAKNHAIERGKDLRGCSLLAFGGAGPVHCWDLARVLRVPRVIVPGGAGALSALGLLTAPVGFDFVRTHQCALGDMDWPAVTGLLREMEHDGRAMLPRDLKASAVQVRFKVDLRYIGQGHEVTIDLPSAALDRSSVPALTTAFEEAYRKIYNHVPQRVGIEATNWRASVVGPEPGGSPWRMLATGLPAKVALAAAVKGHRPAYFGGPHGSVETPVIDRYAMAAGVTFAGPAIIEERESTFVVGPGSRGHVAEDGAIVVEMPEGGSHAT
jgi:N-methylhydantoinase A